MPRKQSELEGFVLGLVWQLGPASPYQLRRHMLASPSTQWSASAGAIYPLLKRLERAGLLRSDSRRTGKRLSRAYQITPHGLRALRVWIGPPLAAEAVTVAHDPLRSRARFLAALTPAQRTQWLAAARAALDRVEELVRAWQEDHASALGASASLTTRSGELDVQSRREWLGALHRASRE